MLLWWCFKCVNYSCSLHIRVNGTNQPMCHGIYNLQWTQFEGVSIWSIIPVRSISVNGTNQPMCHGICNPQCTQFESVSSWSIIPIHSISEWMELFNQCVMVSAIHRAHNLKVFRVGWLIPIHSISEWMELINQCVTVSAIQSAHNLKVFQVGRLFPFTQYQSERN
jgi:hypothetical protein